MAATNKIPYLISHSVLSIGNYLSTYPLVVDFKTIVPNGFTNLQAAKKPDLDPEQSITTSKLLSMLVVTRLFITASGARSTL